MIERVKLALRGFEAAWLLDTGSVNPSGERYEDAKARAAIEAMREPVKWSIGTPEGDRIMGLLRPARIEACRQTDCAERGFNETDCGNCAACADMTYFVGEAYWRAMIDEAL